MKFQQCEMLKNERIEKAEYYYKDWARRFGEENKLYKVSKAWLDSQSISIDSVDVTPIYPVRDERYVCHYKFESGFEN